MIKEPVIAGFKKQSNNLLFYGLSAVVTCIILLFFLYTHGFRLGIFPNYDQDGLALGVVIKTLIESGLSFKNPQLGAPYYYELTQYPLSENATIVIMKLLSLISHNYIVVLNLFFILSFVFVTLTSLFVFRFLGLDKPFAFSASILFSFLPYHFLRMEIGHLLLCAYYVIPIYVLLIFSVLRQALFFGAHDTSLNKRYLLIIAVVLVGFFAAASGVYYAFFAGYLLLIAGIIASIEKKQWFPLGNASVFILIISLSLVINMLPALQARLERGPNQEIAVRNPAEAEYYGLKITQLLLPTDRHRIKSAASFKDYYNSTAPLINENRTASLGIIGSIGFLALLFMLLMRKVPYGSNTLYELSRLNIAAVLLGTVGGLSSIFAYAISPMIRGYNRISLFIAFFSLAAFFLCLQAILKKHDHPNIKKISWVIAILITVLGVADQIPHMAFAKNQAQFISDQKFVTAIEAKMPAGTMIMQLPFMDFPESPSINGMASYSLFRGYLHSHQLHWSFGAMRGRGAALWQKAVTQEPPKEMLDDLVYAGFTGLYIFRDGYSDQGKAIEKQITHLLHEGPILVNEQNDIAFYDLRPYATRLRYSMSTANWQAQVEQTQANISWLDNIHTVWGHGIYSLEQDKDNSWHWSMQKSTLQIYNVFNHDVKVKLNFQLRTGHPEYASIWIDGDLLKETIKVNQAGTMIQRELIIKPGKHSLYFKTDAKQVNSGADPRVLYFAIYNYSIEPV